MIYNWPINVKRFSITNHQRNANQNHNEVSLLTHQIGYYQKHKSVCEDVETLEPLGITDGTVKLHNLDEKRLGAPQKIKNRTTKWSSYPTFGYVSKRTETRVLKRYLHSSTIHNSQEVEAIEMSTNKGINKENVAYTYNGILFTHKKKEILSQLQHGWL